MNNTLLLENGFSVNDLKEEECQGDDFAEDKDNISETAIIIDNAELKDHLIHDKMKQCDISTNLDTIKTELPISEVQYDMIDDNLKMEEEINADDIKIEFYNGLVYCEECHAYREGYCVKFGILVHILYRT